MTETMFTCSVCGEVFPDDRAGKELADKDSISCPNCGSAFVEADHFDPDGPVEDPLEERAEEGQGA